MAGVALAARLPRPRHAALGRRGLVVNPISAFTSTASAQAWGPTAAVQSALVSLHEASGMPWWLTLVTGTVAVRLALLPAVVYQQRQQSRFAHLRPLLRAVADSCKHIPERSKRQAATLSGMWRVSVSHGVHPLSLFSGVLVQLPVFLLCVISVRRMINLAVPAPGETAAAAAAAGSADAGQAAAAAAASQAVPGTEGLVTGGMAWFQDLTAADPVAALPVLTMGAFLVATEASQRGREAPPWLEMLRRRVQDVGVVALPAIASLPAGVFMYWLPNNVLSLAQNYALRAPAVRAALRLDPPPPMEVVPGAAGGSRRGSVRAVRAAQAKALEERGHVQAAAEAYKALIQEEPGDVDAVMALSRLLASSSQEAHQMAVAILEPLVAMKPKERRPRLALVEALRRAGRRGEALKRGRELVAEQADDLRARIALASVLAAPPAPGDQGAPAEGDGEASAAEDRARAADELEAAARMAETKGDDTTAAWCRREAGALRQTHA